MYYSIAENVLSQNVEVVELVSAKYSILYKFRLANFWIILFLAALNFSDDCYLLIFSNWLLLQFMQSNTCHLIIKHVIICQYL